MVDTKSVPVTAVEVRESFSRAGGLSEIIIWGCFMRVNETSRRLRVGHRDTKVASELSDKESSRNLRV